MTRAKIRLHFPDQVGARVRESPTVDDEATGVPP